MTWVVVSVFALLLALAVRWAASAVWVRFISDRWNEFDARETRK